MKKLISSMLALSVLTAAGMPAYAAAQPAPAAPAAAADTLDTRLAAVTQAVKSALPVDALLQQLDGEAEFNGDVNDNALSPRWDLSWSSHAGEISVTAGEDGKVYSYHLRISDSGNRRFWGLDAAFPKADPKQALAAAQSFADRLMGAGESVQLGSSNAGQTDTLVFTGNLLFNGLPSPVDIRVQVRPDDLAVTQYIRDDSYSSILPGLPPAESATTAAAASGLLRSTLDLKPYYVLNEDGKTASLRYVRQSEKNYIVTAADGRLVDLDKVYADLVSSYAESGLSKSGYRTTSNESTADAGAPASSAGGAQLSESELKTIDGLKDVHTREQLDQTLRAVPALGLDHNWTLERVSYSQDRTTGEISAQLRYARPPTDAERKALKDSYQGELLQIQKTIRMNARTNALQSIYTANYYPSPRASAVQNDPQSPEQTQAAEAFLAAQLPAQWRECKPYSAGDDNHLMYAQNVNGYLFPSNRLTIRMDADGTVESLLVNWDDSITFAGADGILSANAAADACMNAFEMPLSYVEYPVLENQILTRKYVLAYAFRYSDGRSFQGIDAKTGEPVWKNYSEPNQYEYTDLAGAFGRTQIEALAAYGVGLPGGRFQPSATLDQKTMLALLLSACGTAPDPSTEEGLDELYTMAYNENLLKAAGRAPDASVTRIEFLRTLLGASIYSDAAKVKGIYTCPFTDRDAIAQSDLGYASLASGLGIARGDDKGRLNPDSTMTRQEAAVMLYNFMMR